MGIVYFSLLHIRRESIFLWPFYTKYVRCEVKVETVCILRVVYILEGILMELVIIN